MTQSSLLEPDAPEAASPADAPRRTWWRPGPRSLNLASALLAGAVAAAGLLLPLITLASAGLSLVWMTEESTGFRYFYSLRHLSTRDERPWIPQGQIVGLIHFGIQGLLTLLGYPPTQLQPRIDRFDDIATALPGVATGIALAWAVLPLRTLGGRLAVAAALFVAALDPGLNAGYHLLQPDYPPWIHTLGMIALGCCLRLTDGVPRPGWRWTIGLGLFAGVCLGVKVTLATLAMPPAILLLLDHRPSWARRVLDGVAMALIGAAVLFWSTWAYYMASVEATIRYFTILQMFSGVVRAKQSLGLVEWTLGLIRAAPAESTRHAASLPVVLALSAALLRPRTVSVALLAGSALSILIYWMRDEPTTLIEIYDYALLAIVVWVVRVGMPNAVALARRLAPPRLARPRLAASVTAALPWLLLLYLYQPIAGRAASPGPTFLASFSAANAIQRALDDLVADHAGRVAVMVHPENFASTTLDSAIYKGGTNIAESAAWGASPFVQSLVPDRTYFTQGPVDLAQFQYLIVVVPETPGQAERVPGFLASTYGVSLLGFECPVQIPTPIGGDQYGCRRRPDAPAAQRTGEIGFIASATALTASSVVTAADGTRRPVQPGEAVYAGDTREIWRLDADGAFTRLVGAPGETVPVGLLGAWPVERQAPSPYLAAYQGNHWVVDGSTMTPINRNADLTRQRNRRPPSEWQVVGAPAVSGEPGREGDRGWLELRARNQAPVLGMRTVVDVSGYPGAPLSAVVTLRGFLPGHVVTGLIPVGGTGTEHAAVVDEVPSGDWRTIVLYLNPGDVTDGQVEVAITVQSPRVGDRLDVGRVEVYAGRYPAP